jgi:hypothetical protein
MSAGDQHRRVAGIAQLLGEVLQADGGGLVVDVGREDALAGLGAVGDLLVHCLLEADRLAEPVGRAAVAAARVGLDCCARQTQSAGLIHRFPPGGWTARRRPSRPGRS